MRFSAYLWQLYRESDDGAAAVEQFEDWLGLSTTTARSDVSVDAHELVPEPHSEDGASDNDANALFEPSDDDCAIASFVEREARALDGGQPRSAADLYWALHEVGISIPVEGSAETFPLGGVDGAENWVREISGVSLGLAWARPDDFVPYLFVHKFNLFQSICDELGIPIPLPPRRADWEERARFYQQINEALQEFRVGLDIGPAELCALLYDFGPRQVHKTVGEYPAPRKAWLLIGGAGGPADFDFADNLRPDSSSFWQCHPDVRRGDVCVLYLVRPRSSVHSIWRAASDGFVDPFFHYYSTVIVDSPRPIPPIPFRELKADPTLGANPAVRASLVGASGKPLSAAEYEALLALVRRRGGASDALPLLHAPDPALPADLTGERDIELRLVEPLLREIGFADRDWTRQFPLRMGRGERVYPDYVFGFVPTPGDETARMILEIKFRIATRRQLREAWIQAKSYALRLRSEVVVLAALDGVWVIDDPAARFDPDRFVVFRWSELKSVDGLHRAALTFGPASRWWNAPRGKLS